MKENDGAARRSQLLRTRHLVLIASSISFLFGCITHRAIPRDETYPAMQVDGTGTDRADPLDEFVRDELAPALGSTQMGRLRRILSASWSLVNIGFVESRSEFSIKDDSYAGVMAEFCPLNFTTQGGRRPGRLLSFEGVGAGSPCLGDGRGVVRVDLGEVVRMARAFDAKRGGDGPAILDLRGVVFHEGSCGSNFAAMAMAALNPEKHRVYVHPQPAEFAMGVCGEDGALCSTRAAANLMRDVLYMMSRSGDPREERVYFIFRPESIRTMEIFRTAFPTTPWIFLYREPVEAILSQRGRFPPDFSSDPSPMVSAYLKKKARGDIEEVTDTEILAAQMATFCLSALRNFGDVDGLGLAVKFTRDLAGALAEAILPTHFHTRVDREGKRRILMAYKEYQRSEDGLRPAGSSDDKPVLENAPKQVKDVAKTFLKSSYKKLEDSQFNLKNCRHEKPAGGVFLRCDDIEKDDD